MGGAGLEGGCEVHGEEAGGGRGAGGGRLYKGGEGGLAGLEGGGREAG